jgi:thymidine phosphorylase
MRKSFKKGLKPRVNTGIKKKVRFTDEVTKGGEIATIYEVESFKTKESTKSLRGSGSGEVDENFHCKCSIF